MSRLTEIFKSIGTNPVLAIEFVLSVGLLLYGLYIGSPLYIPSGNSALGIFFELTLVRAFVALLYIVPSIAALWGVWRSELRFRVWGTYGLFFAFTFTTIFRIVAVGWTPLFWVFYVMLSLVAGIIHLHLKAGESNG